MEKPDTIAKMRGKATPGATHVTPDWRIMLDMAEKVGLGTQLRDENQAFSYDLYASFEAYASLFSASLSIRITER